MKPAGIYREKVTIERATRNQRPDGGWETTWTTVIETLTNVQQKLPSHDVIAQQENIIAPFYFHIRFRRDVSFKIGDRITWRGREFKLLKWTWDIRRTELVIVASTENETTDVGS